MKKTILYIAASTIGFGLMLTNCSKKADPAPAATTGITGTTTTGTTTTGTTTTGTTTSGTTTSGSTTSATTAGSTTTGTTTAGSTTSTPATKNTYTILGKSYAITFVSAQGQGTDPYFIQGTDASMKSSFSIVFNGKPTSGKYAIEPKDIRLNLGYDKPAAGKCFMGTSNTEDYATYFVTKSGIESIGEATVTVTGTKFTIVVENAMLKNYPENKMYSVSANFNGTFDTQGYNY